ncbi:uncharacterized protein LOC128737971 [Sabethes cyaneus]|uniref:uncharacterized protein LOC128737971 n=1 Tax=Sabethes cyaneus TaxID=53552 RepID=UPI00237E84BB|nr:uncharacterized protein LOC128737971 [Sabethes cyaneus]
MQYGRKCLLCKSTRYRERSCRLFKFPPRGSPMWSRWLTACGFKEKDIDENSREPPRLCQKHFLKKDFLTRKLTATAVPSVFPLNVYTEIAEDVINSRSNDCVSSDTVSEKDVDYSVEPSQQLIGEVYGLVDVLPTGVNDLIEFTGTEPDEIVEEITAGDLPSSQNPTDDDDVLVSCYVENHWNLLDHLREERAKVEQLAKKLNEKERLIGEQSKILKQLGVQFETHN